jgi:cellulose synthase/poly-beta-1,6-N-acetylglucosamine synthase-like glycosyltransferase
MEPVFIFIFLLYFILLVALIIGWRRAMNSCFPKAGDKENFITVIIPVRNEELPITAIIQDLKNQLYDSFEVIFVNDHSEDRTFAVIDHNIQDDSRFSIINSAGSGKKAALENGIAFAKGNLIVTTDADCCVGPEWLNGINQYFQDDNTKLAFGGVRMTKDDDLLFSNMQAIEFSSLIGTGAATIILGFPTMCNGANLVFTKEVINEVGGFADNKHIPSGDDEFLLRKVFDKYPKGICFMATSEVIVSTIPQPTLFDFIQQRIRWAGKWRFHNKPGSKVLAIFTILFQITFLLVLPFTLGGLVSIEVFILLVLIKILGEAYFLTQVSDFLKIRWNWLAFIILQFLYPFYVVFIGIVSQFQPFTWKGRLMKSIKTNVGTIADND